MKTSQYFQKKVTVADTSLVSLKLEMDWSALGSVQAGFGKLPVTAESCHIQYTSGKNTAKVWIKLSAHPYLKLNWIYSRHMMTDLDIFSCPRLQKRPVFVHFQKTVNSLKKKLCPLTIGPIAPWASDHSSSSLSTNVNVCLARLSTHNSEELSSDFHQEVRLSSEVQYALCHLKKKKYLFFSQWKSRLYFMSATKQYETKYFFQMYSSYFYYLHIRNIFKRIV